MQGRKGAKFQRKNLYLCVLVPLLLVCPVGCVESFLVLVCQVMVLLNIEKQKMGIAIAYPFVSVQNLRDWPLWKRLPRRCG
jgi:hypothetical protein